ncbi:MAG TPA: PhzF family phenazine biosynthesis protein [Gammaproteobacteria bacterium]|nr:PhzF family phenazine biosynthesis protein [Gammaproteobacteria bacterium]
MTIPLYQLDAFASKMFSGNPAGVCPLLEWPDDGLMQAIAAENNLSETAFFTGKGGRYRLRWFAPLAEVDMCGHATLATAWVILHHLEPKLEYAEFETRSGLLRVERAGAQLKMFLPQFSMQRRPAPPALSRGLPVEILEVYESIDYVAVCENASAVYGLKPNQEQLKLLDLRGVAVTARGDDCDLVCRVFGPKIGVPEDPVTGSAYCYLAPYWASRMNKTRLRARQLSSRGAELECEVLEDGKVALYGRCVEYMRGELLL